MVIEQNEPVARKFVMHMSNWLGGVDDRTIYRALPQGPDGFEPIRTAVISVLEKINFQSAGFIALCIEFIKVEQPEQTNAIMFVPLKKHKVLMVSKTIHNEVVRAAMQDDFDRFIIAEIAKVLRVLCDKYKLNPKPIDELAPQDHALKPALEVPQSIEELDLNNELVIHVKLRDRKFGDRDEFDNNTQLMDDLDALLSDERLGHVDGSTIGMGYETITCVGGNARSMYERVAVLLASLPQGSYVEIVTDGRTDRVYPEWITKQPGKT